MSDYFNYIAFGSADYVAEVGGPLEMSRGRMFEYTPTELEKRLEGLDARSLAFLETLPTFLCSEATRTPGGGFKMLVRFGRVAAVGLGGKEVRATFQPQVEFGEVVFQDLKAARSVFEADEFQLYRTHWAVREGDADAVLARLRALAPEVAEVPAAEAAPADAEPPPREKHMDVTPLPVAGQSLVSGQVVLSMPGEPCLRCLQLVTDEQLKAEAQRYGVAGSRPQVVWPNGLLASTAVGLVVQLLTPWMADPPRSAYFAYDANLGMIAPSDRLARRRGKPCPHYPARAVGDPMFDVRRYVERLNQPAFTEPPVSVPVSRVARLLGWIRERFGRG